MSPITPLQQVYAHTWRQRALRSPTAMFVAGLATGVVATLVLLGS